MDPLLIALIVAGTAINLLIWGRIVRRSRYGRRRLKAQRTAERRTHFGPDEPQLPPADFNFAPMAAMTVDADPNAFHHPGRLPFDEQVARLRSEFAGRSELALLHASCVSRLRRYRDRPPARNALLLFERMWEETRGDLIGQLNLRWLGSAAATFADHGETEADRRTGLLAVALLDMAKLYETERLELVAGQRGGRTATLFDGVAPYSPEQGDLIDHMAERIEAASAGDAAPQAILAEIWRRLNAEDTVLKRMLARSQRRRS